ncbi:MAG TPA: hypothetical protein VNK95_01705, partial [Caldilineaceae bacterium]|nr:hypothetical protein [Caldilineaceae bacterium]
GGYRLEVTTIKLVIGLLIVAFALLDLLPRFRTLAFDRRYLTVGGLLSGFFGGLSGNQGALRSAFLIKAGLQKEAFIGTGTVSAVVVDVARLLVYGFGFYAANVGVADEGGACRQVLRVWLTCARRAAGLRAKPAVMST